MREIKFRVWDHSYQEMVNSVSIIHCDLLNKTDVRYYVGKQYVLKGAYSVDVELMQHTGLIDKNRADIYEGDIVKVIDINTGEESFHTVKYYAYDDYPAFDLSPILFEESNSFSGIACSMQYEIEVVGNVYENNDLLGG